MVIEVRDQALPWPRIITHHVLFRVAYSIPVTILKFISFSFWFISFIMFFIFIL